MIKDVLIPLIGIVVQLIIAGISIWITNRQLSNNDKKTRLNNIDSSLDNLRTKSCEYWGKTSMTPEYQQLLECEIKSALEDIKLALKGLYDKFKSLRSEIHKMQTEVYVDMNKLITGGSFETKTRVADKDKCNKIIASISEFKKIIEDFK
jgi:uncharacterized membrane-anchored protein YhcB (DUF1043 family)